jgi:hypothetical protein
MPMPSSRSWAPKKQTLQSSEDSSTGEPDTATIRLERQSLCSRDGCRPICVFWCAFQRPLARDHNSLSDIRYHLPGLQRDGTCG